MDYIIKFIVDVFQSIPPLVVLIIFAISIPGDMTILQLSLIVGVTSWLGPTRVLRSQVLVMKELNYVSLSRFSGLPSWKIIFMEILPNLLPYVMANFVMTVAGAILASIGIEALGLGAFSSNSLGMTIYWNIWYSSLLQGWWWWWSPPILIIILVFVSLYLISQGLDEWANPRLKTKF
ncbi:MAG: ABC transporter permease subunit [SAR324 cluster bacterium]|nr:ABC transporter permease subunit [SAR324 cluster bacterium]